MKNREITILLLFLLVFPSTISAQAVNQIISGKKYVIHSEIIGEEKEYWVHLPVDYEASTIRYPVLYITDGDDHFQMAVGAAGFMGSQYVIPELIVVAVVHKDRNHDLTPTHSLKNLDGFESNAAKVSGGGEKLLQFIEKELIPEIESSYRTGPYRILAGHSLGGLLSVYAWLNHNRLFNAFIAIDPALTWDNYCCERIIKNAALQSPELSSKLYIASAHNAPFGKKDRSPFRLSQESFIKALESKTIVNYKHDYFENHDHLTVPYKSLYNGLVCAFPGFYILNHPEFKLALPFIEEFYRKQSEIYGIEFKPSERLIEMFGKYFLFDVNDYANAIKFFEFNTNNYPSSFKAFKYLAKAYLAAGNTPEAVKNLKKALGLNPGDKEIQELLIEAGGQ
ncbi:MAG: tetratricopeptide repeat protein [Bacteroidales bacterium]|nr:tetratricopeptide repeat protein [Bacteroidales bacterium]